MTVFCGKRMGDARGRRRGLVGWLWLVLAAAATHDDLAAGERGLVDVSRSRHVAMSMVDLDDVRWGEGLLGERFEVCRAATLPHLWQVFQDSQASHAWDNFRLAAGETEVGRGDGLPHGPPFNDGDFLKWLEAVVQVQAVAKQAPPGLGEAETDAIIAVIAKAQRPDGYLHTPTIVRQRAASGSQEFADREHFETYNMGHLMTTACVHHRATGKTTLLDCGIKAADYLDRLCREKPEELARNAICPSHMMGVAELYRLTHEPRYLELARRLVAIRDLVPPEVASDQNQDRVPFRQATEAVGHAVRANYLYAGVADLVAEAEDPGLTRSLAALDRDVAGGKLYVTGMTGALYDGASPDGVPSKLHAAIKTVHQAYGRPYQLPNLTAYNETCATIGYAMWLWRMLLVTGEPRYADLFEEVLYNGVLPGVSLDGTDYFYVNPLRKLADFRVPLRWSRTRTPTIPSSFCCPPNVARTIAEAHNYCYTVGPDALWVQLYAASELDTTLPGGGRLRLRQKTEFPWAGQVTVVIAEAPEREIDLRLRIPGWVRPGGATLTVNGQPTAVELTPGTYAALPRRFSPGDRVELNLAMPPVLVEANPLVEETLGQVAVRRGPLVYCLEANDLPEGVRLMDVVIPVAGCLESFATRPGEIAGTRVELITAAGAVRSTEPWPADRLYREVPPSATRPINLTFVPYYAWGNRGDTDMTVWVPAAH
jgi:DUF1680 family protein